MPSQNRVKQTRKAMAKYNNNNNNNPTYL